MMDTLKDKELTVQDMNFKELTVADIQEHFNAKAMINEFELSNLDEQEMSTQLKDIFNCQDLIL